MATATTTQDAMGTTVPGVDRKVINLGLIGGGVAVYFVAVGMVEKFDVRPVIADIINLGRLLLVLTLIIFGYLAASSREKLGAPQGAARYAAGAVAGLVGGAMMAAVLLAVNAVGVVKVRTMFVSFTPNLVNEVLSFGQGIGFGAAALTISGMVSGLIGAGLQQITRRVRLAIFAGAATMIIVSLAQPFLSQVSINVEENFGIPLPLQWLYPRGGGLTTVGTIIMLALGAGVSWWRTGGGRFRQTDARPGVKERARDIGMATWVQRNWPKIVGWILLLALLLLLPRMAGPFLSQVLVRVGTFVLLGLGLNIVVGFAGLLDLGYVAFFAVGAYATAVLTSPASFLGGPEGGLMNFWVALPLVVVIAVVAGLMIGAPVLRLRGDYLAIVTLGFGEIARVLIASNWLSEFLGGAQGILRIPAPPPETFDLRRPENLYYLILAASLLAAFISFRLKDSRVGRAWAAMREDESVAEAMGISVINYKLLAFGIGAGVGCLGGAIFAIQVGSVFPNSFNLLVSINALSVIVLGGMGSIPGVVVGALALVGLPELLREFEEFRLLIYGAVLVSLMILKPEGLLPEVRRKQELHERELEEEQYERRVGEGAEPVLRAEPSDDEETT